MEVLIKIGDSGGSKDGQIISVLPDGWLISALDMKAWLDDGIESAVLGDMPEYQVRRLQRRINRLRWVLAHTAAEFVAEFLPPVRTTRIDPITKAVIILTPEEIAEAMDQQEQEAEREMAIAVADRTRMIALGVDTNWGYEDLKVHWAVRLEKLNDHDYPGLKEREQDIDHQGRITAKRRYRVAYESHHTVAQLTNIRDPAKRIEVDRMTELPRTAVEAITAKGL